MLHQTAISLRFFAAGEAFPATTSLGNRGADFIAIREAEMSKPIHIRDSTEFDFLMKRLARDIVDANIHYRLYKNLNNAIPEYVAELNQSTAFWNLTISAQIDATLLRLCRAYDSHTVSLNLPRLLATIEANLHIFDTPDFKQRLKDNLFVESLTSDCRIPDKNGLKADITLVSSTDTLVKRLLVWRNNIGAHRNPRETLTPNSVVLVPLKCSEIESLLERAISILNKYSLLFGAIAYSTSMVGAEDYKYVLGCIGKDMVAMNSKFEQDKAKYENVPYPTAASDCLQRPIRSRFQQQVGDSVGLGKK